MTSTEAKQDLRHLIGHDEDAFGVNDQDCFGGSVDNA